MTAPPKKHVLMHIKLICELKLMSKINAVSGHIRWGRVWKHVPCTLISMSILQNRDSKCGPTCGSSSTSVTIAAIFAQSAARILEPRLCQWLVTSCDCVVLFAIQAYSGQPTHQWCSSKQWNRRSEANLTSKVTRKDILRNRHFGRCRYVKSYLWISLGSPSSFQISRALLSDPTNPFAGLSQCSIYSIDVYIYQMDIDIIHNATQYHMCSIHLFTHVKSIEYQHAARDWFHACEISAAKGAF